MIELIQSLYSLMGIQQNANEGDLYGLSAVIIILVGGFFRLIADSDSTKISDTSKRPETLEVADNKDQPEKEAQSSTVGRVVEETPEPIIETKISWSQRLKKGLSQSRGQVWGKLGGLFNGTGLDEDKLEEVEELLHGADIGPTTASELMEELETKAKQDGFGESEFKSFLFDFLKKKMIGVQSGVDHDLYQYDEGKKGKTKVIMVVGVNGAGKTTTIGKLATKLTNQGANVVVGACDTFRAAAVDQLEVWCDRAGAKMIRAKEGSNPSGVGYEALQYAINESADYCILDTAGRLHTKGNLMEELAKSKNVLKKLDSEAPHQVLLVIDAITGQNAIRQAEEFNKTLGLTGLILTKLDGSSKAGSAVSIVNQLNVPITYIGVGETVDDLNIFNLDDYLGALLDV